ncbi:MAG TPA: LysM peptidoglycan-binding domain-containing protein [Actinomycetales bacterium]|nr:LysM peptidoglycan-binding domain-containing protein [Actinomycetales bacterium]
MSVITLHSPSISMGRAEARRGQEPVAAAVPLRLTRRGRLVITLFVAALLAVGALLGAQTALAGSSVETPAVETLTVAPGDTLWSIASSVSDEGDVRDTIAEIRDLNALRSSELLVGQELLVPTS